MKYTKRIATVLIAIACALGLAVPAAAREEHWYCVHVKNHERPRIDPAFSYVEQYGGYYIGKDEQQKVIYLTFDAGYENGNVEKILNILKEKDVPAAFFILSHLLKANAPLVTRMFDEGHLVCNHTASHRNMAALTDACEFEAELASLEALCRELTGRDMAKYYRPPEGAFSESNLKQADALGYRTIFWSFAYADWDNGHQMSEAAAIEKIMSNVHPGEVMLLHPTSATNAAVLGEVIDQCRAMGYRFGTLNELTQKER